MEKIVLEVSNDIARKWNSASGPKRNKVMAILGNALDLIDEQSKSTAFEKGYGLPDDEAIQKFEKKAKGNREAYEQSLTQLRKKAKGNGLTEEILERLLNE